MAVTYNFTIPISNRGSLPAWMFEQYNPDNPSQPLARALEGELTIKEDGSIQIPDPLLPYMQGIKIIN